MTDSVDTLPVARKVEPAVSMATWHYAKCQPFLMAFFWGCAETIQDPMFFWPYAVVSASLAFYLIGAFVTPLWMIIRRWVVDALLETPAPLRKPVSWLRMSVGAVPLLIFPSLMYLLDGPRDKAAFVTGGVILTLSALLASIVGTLRYLYVYSAQKSDAPAARKRRKRVSRISLVVLLVLALTATLFVAQIRLNTPDLAIARKRLDQTVPPHIARSARNVYFCQQIGYGLASGDPALYKLRFDTDADVIQAMVLATQEQMDGLPLFEEDVEPSGPRWWVRGRVLHGCNSNTRYWFDTQANRVFIETYSRD